VANRALATQGKVEGIVLKAAWQWGSNSSVINDPLGDPGHIPLYVGFLYMCCSMDSDRMFPPTSWENSLTGDSERYK